ncbi:replication factor C subunit 4-like [Antedon mediterranea]|uniref:replication factor C subunit 4-like n=1 Tax=Antedon mediterranea TaxID=105859 RepID=UPI003AF51211
MDAFLKTKSGLPIQKPKKKDEEGSSERKKSAVTPWVEKYRPKTVDEVSFQDEVVAVLKKSLEGADLPNLLFYGPPGTGKTSTILAISRELFSADIYKSRVLELNASDERGINVVRDKIKNFAQHTANTTKPDGTPCPPFKIIILDEADSMTTHAQAALRRTMETQSKTTRFCLICNYISRIIAPITSRCAKFRFKPLGVKHQKATLLNIAGKENVKCSERALLAIIQVTEGDLRKAITLLQSAHRLKGEEGITEDDIQEIAGSVPVSVVSDLIKTCHSNSFEKLDDAVTKTLAEGYAASQMILQIHEIIVSQPDLNDNQKSKICERLAIVDKRLIDGADEYLQIMDLLTVVMTQYCTA